MTSLTDGYTPGEKAACKYCGKTITFEDPDDSELPWKADDPDSGGRWWSCDTSTAPLKSHEPVPPVARPDLSHLNEQVRDDLGRLMLMIWRQAHDKMAVSDMTAGALTELFGPDWYGEMTDRDLL